MTEPAITPELVAKHNLTPEEYTHAKEILGGRTPSYTELGIFSVMWSEHCSYKNTRPLLKTFPTKSPKILVGAGEENAGIIDIGDGLAIAFKIESHNHPSAVEPFQGAATGVGGIVRDIFTMGARPVCAVNSLRFGPIVDEERRGVHSNEKIETSCIDSAMEKWTRSCKQPPLVRRRRQRHCALRQLLRHPDHRGRSLFRQILRRQSARERVLPRRAAARANRARRGQGRGQSGVLRRPGHGSRRPGGRGVCLAGFDRGIRRATARRGAGGRSVHGKTRVRSVPRIARHRRGRRHAGHGRGGLDLFHLRNGRARRHGHRDRTGQSSATRAEHEQLRNHAFANRRNACSSSSTKAAKRK